MPTLFDSHAEFSEWFSKDIESHAQGEGNVDRHQLSRLHMILKPFMLRRVKKDVEHELGDKVALLCFFQQFCSFDSTHIPLFLPFNRLKLM